MTQRLDEYLTRMADETLEADAQAAPITRAQNTGCTELDVSGPSWGVVPHAERVVTAGAKARKYFDDLHFWLLTDWFSPLGDSGKTTDDSTGKSVRTITLESRDGVLMTLRWFWDEPQITISATGPCTWPADRSGGPPGGQLPPLPPPAWPTKPISPKDSELCTSPKRKVFNPEAPAFAGPAPHPVALVFHSDEDRFHYKEPLMSANWAPIEGSFDDSLEHENTQLLVCVRVQPAADTGRDVTCYYSASLASPVGGTPYEFDVLDASYQVTVRQARDGAVVEEFTLPGTVDGDRNCLMEIRDYYGKLALGLDSDVLQDRLRPLAEQPR